MLWLALFFISLAMTVYLYKNPDDNIAAKLGIEKPGTVSKLRDYRNLKLGFLSELNYFIKLAEVARDKGVHVSTGHLGAVSLFIATTSFIAGNIMFQSVIFGFIVAAIVFYGGSRLYVETLVLKQRQKIDDQADILLQSLCASLRGGKTLTGALGLAGNDTPSPLGDLVKEAYQEITHGNEDFDKALRKMTQKSGHHNMIDNITSVIIITRETGGNIIHNLDNLREIINDEEYTENLIKSKTSNSISTAFVLNVVGLFLMFTINRAYPDALNQLFFQSYFGRLILLTLLGSVGAGWIIIYRLVNVQSSE